MKQEVSEMFRLQVKCQGRWRWGIVQYDNLTAANERVAELGKVGIKARVRKNEEFFN